MNWITSWPSVVIGAIGLVSTYCAVLWDSYKTGKEGEEDEECWREDAGAADR